MWKQEIEELHQVFESYFVGVIDSLARVEAALASDFVIVGPNGHEDDRTSTLAALTGAHGQIDSLAITITDPRLIAESPDMVVAAYIENQASAERTTRRQATVVFRRDETAPNGLQWLRVHETWIE